MLLSIQQVLLERVTLVSNRLPQCPLVMERAHILKLHQSRLLLVLPSTTKGNMSCRNRSVSHTDRKAWVDPVGLLLHTPYRLIIDLLRQNETTCGRDHIDRIYLLRILPYLSPPNPTTLPQSDVFLLLPAALDQHCHPQLRAKTTSSLLPQAHPSLVVQYACHKVNAPRPVWVRHNDGSLQRLFHLWHRPLHP